MNQPMIFLKFDIPKVFTGRTNGVANWVLKAEERMRKFATDAGYRVSEGPCEDNPFCSYYLPIYQPRLPEDGSLAPYGIACLIHPDWWDKVTEANRAQAPIISMGYQ